MCERGKCLSNKRRNNLVTFVLAVGLNGGLNQIIFLRRRYIYTNLPVNAIVRLAQMQISLYIIQMYREIFAFIWEKWDELI